MGRRFGRCRVEGCACRQSEGILLSYLCWNFLWVGGLGGVGFGDAPAARVRVFCYFFSVGVVGGELCY